jgi:hypothetical protein
MGKMRHKRKSTQRTCDPFWSPLALEDLAYENDKHARLAFQRTSKGREGKGDDMRGSTCPAKGE